MSYSITSDDIRLAQSRIKDVRCRIQLLSYESGSHIVLDTMEYILNGSYSESAESDARRSFSATLIQMDKSYTVGEYQRIWVDKRVRVSVGYADPRTREVSWYDKGIFLFSDCTGSSGVDSRQISVSCCDLVATLDGTAAGQIDTVSLTIPAGSVIRDAVIQTLSRFTEIPDYRIDEIGVYTCLEGTVSNYLQQRQSLPEWNQVPYDLEFGAGCTVWEILTKLRDLYPGFEMFFDEEGRFICQRIPNCDKDDLALSHEIIDDLVLSENTSVNISQIRNATKIYGKSIEPDRFADTVSVSGRTYTVTLDNFSCGTNTVIALKVPANSQADMQIQVTGSGTTSQTNRIMKRVTHTDSADEAPPSDAYDSLTATKITYKPYEPGFFKAGETYCFKYSKCIPDGRTEPVWYWICQGQFQVEALYRNEDEGTAFCVQKIGERLQVLSGGEYDAIPSNELAMEQASYQTWKSSRLTDTITLELFDIPFLCVNQKVSYTPGNEDYPQTYIIKSISENFGSGLMTLTMMKFYRLYPNIVGAT